jgi:hypothetical protein
MELHLPHWCNGTYAESRRGDDESRGLVKLGLVEGERGRHGRLEARLTVFGRAMVLAQLSTVR